MVAAVGSGIPEATRLSRSSPVRNPDSARPATPFSAGAAHPLTGLSVCSGIGAPELAAPWIDWKWQSEIAAFPSPELAARFPGAVNLGDMTKFKRWPDATFDVLAGGTPCQSYSVAGLRKGLADPRGSLVLTFLAIAREFAPRWIVWENVAGVLSSNGGRDFGTFLRGLELSGYGWAYRVLDSEYVRVRRWPRAVPQGRRRVFVVGYLGDWRPAAAVCFDPEGLRGDPAPAHEIRPEIAAPLDGGGSIVHYPEFAVCGALTDGAHSGGGTNGQDVYTGRVIAFETPEGLFARRLTITECERVMGFPDHWTDVPFNGKTAPISKRYKAVSDSWAVNCGALIFDRLRAVETMVA